MPIGYRVQTYTTTGTFQSWNLDHAVVPMNTSIRITVNATTAAYGLQWNLTPLGPTDPDTVGNWVTDNSIGTASITSASSTYVTPVARVRLIITALNATGTITMESLQGMSTN